MKHDGKEHKKKGIGRDVKKLYRDSKTKFMRSKEQKKQLYKKKIKQKDVRLSAVNK